MRVVRMLTVTILAVAVVVAAGGDPWDGETASWDKKTADKILQSSPWAKRVAMSVTWGEAGMEKDRAASKNSSVNRNDREQLESDFAVVWWWSARTPRRAYLRLTQLAGNQIEQAEVDRFCETAMPNPQISLMTQGPQTSIAARLSAEELKSAAWLETPRAKKVMAVDAKPVLIGNRVDRIIFIFPDQVDGQPLVNAQDKRILFRWKLPKRPNQKVEDADQYEASFEPKKMMARGVADF